MDSLIHDALELLQEISKTTPSVLATAEEVAYFGSQDPSHNTFENKNLKIAPTLQDKQLLKNLQSPVEQPIAGQRKSLPIESKEGLITPLPPKNKPLAEKVHFNEMWQVVQKIFPDLALRDTIPDDALAKKMSRLWEESYLNAQVVIIAFGEVGLGMEFLKQVTWAIHQLLAPAQLVEGSSFEKDKSWDLLLNSPSLKTVLCSPWASWKTTSLSKYYRQNGASGQQFLGQHRLLLLEPSLIYLKHPERKRELWKILSTQLLS